MTLLPKSENILKYAIYLIENWTHHDYLLLQYGSLQITQFYFKIDA